MRLASQSKDLMFPIYKELLYKEINKKNKQLHSREMGKIYYWIVFRKRNTIVFHK